jgi:hypothetical protein
MKPPQQSRARSKRLSQQTDTAGAPCRGAAISEVRAATAYFVRGSVSERKTKA